MPTAQTPKQRPEEGQGWTASSWYYSDFFVRHSPSLISPPTKMRPTAREIDGRTSQESGRARARARCAIERRDATKRRRKSGRCWHLAEGKVGTTSNGDSCCCSLHTLSIRPTFSACLVVHCGRPTARSCSIFQHNSRPLTDQHLRQRKHDQEVQQEQQR